MPIRIDQFEIGNMRNYVYLLTNGAESFVVDPQPEIAPWVEKMKKLKSTLKGVLLTHTHHDHVGGLPMVIKTFPVPIHVHKDDAHRLKDFFKPVVKFIEEGQKISLGGDFIHVMHTPGHSEGECCFLMNENHLLTGDTVFVGMVGRTDLPTGSDEKLFKTILRLKEMSHQTVLYPGHNYGPTPTTTVGRECAKSAAFQCKTLEEFKAVP